MQFSLLDNVFWAGSFVAEIALIIVLLVRGRWKLFPVFTALIGYYIVQTIVMFFVYRYGTADLYRFGYWIAFVIDISLQVALIFEIARIVLRPTGTWVQDARSTFLIWGIVGALIALALAYAVKPSAPKSIDAWGIRAFLFTSLLFCELFVVMMFAAQRLGLVWKNHVMRLGQGLTAWALISAVVDTAHSYFGAAHLYDFARLEHIRIGAYIVAVIYWIVAFWLPEPERRPLSAEMRQYLVDLHAKVQYDSSQVSSAQNLR